MIGSIGTFISVNGPNFSNISFSSSSVAEYAKFRKNIRPDSDISSSFFNASSCLDHFEFFCSTFPVDLDSLFFSVKSVNSICLPSAGKKKEKKLNYNLSHKIEYRNPYSKNFDF